MATSDLASRVATETEWLARVKFYMQKSAIAVMAELGSVANHTERVAYAKKVLDGTASIVEYSFGVVTNSTVLAAISDSLDDNGVIDADLEFTVNSLFNAYAGVALP